MTQEVDGGENELRPCNDNILRCPECLGNLIRNDGSLKCVACNREYRSAGGIPDLRVARFDYYFNPIPREMMKNLSLGLSPNNWTGSVQEFIRQGPGPSWIDNVVVQSRYAWKMLMELPPNARVLDIGCGLGALIGSVAPHVSSAWAADLTIERLFFAQGRFRIFNPESEINTVAAGDGKHLPFPDQSFDAVFLSGVLEWVGEGDTSGFHRGSKAKRLMRMISSQFGDTNPRKIQVQFLKEIKRILRPDGELYIGIENRLNHEYFGKRRDHHSALWFGSLMPRFLANLYSIALARRPYRTYTYSRRGYRRLLSDAGFPEVDIFGFYDGYSNLNSIRPIDAKVPRWNATTSNDQRSIFSGHPEFAPAFGLFASQVRTGKNRLIDRLLREIESELGGRIGFSRFIIGHSDKAMIIGEIDNSPMVIKLPMSSVSIAREEHNQKILRALAERNPNNITVVAESLANGVIQNQPYYVERFMHGVNLEGYQPETPEHGAWRHSLISILENNHAAGFAVVFDGALFKKIVQPRLDKLTEAVHDIGQIKLISDSISTGMSGLVVREGLMHGDLSPGHVLVHEGNIGGLIDWHAGATDGLPIIDIVMACLGVCKATAGDKGYLDNARRLLSHPDDSLMPVARCFDHDLNSVQLTSLFSLCWLFYITNRLPFYLQYDEARLSRMMNDYLVFVSDDRGEQA